jgi:hypothetical protein
MVNEPDFICRPILYIQLNIIYDFTVVNKY